MRIEKLAIEGAYQFFPRVFGDSRGYFFESFSSQKLPRELQNINFVQDNESKSSKGVLRGMHLQLPPFEQAKLVRVISGHVLDVFFDARPGSPTFKKTVQVELDDKQKNQLYIPAGCLHGFLVLSETAVFSYKVDNYYSPEHERGVIYNDPALNISWPADAGPLVISEKDQELPHLDEFLQSLKHD